MTDYKARFEDFYAAANRRSRGGLALLRQVIQQFFAARGPEAASSLAYFAFFSLIPLALVMISLAGFLVKNEEAVAEAFRFVRLLVPARQEWVETTLHDMIRLRGAIGLVGLIGAFWASSGFFSVLVHNINLAWPQALARHPFKNRMLGLIMVIVLIILLLLSFLTSVFSSLLPSLSLPVRMQNPALFSGIWRFILSLLPWVFTFLMFLSLYRWVPNIDVRWKTAMLGAAFATIAWELAKFIFAWYLGSGLSSFDLVYGSLGTIAVLMFWMYVSGWIVLLGAHFCAAADGWVAIRRIPSGDVLQSS